MNKLLIQDRSTWNRALLALPGPHVLQSWEWGQVKSRHAWKPTRLLWQQNGQPVAAAQVLRRPLLGTLWGMMYVPKGPLLDHANSTVLSQVLADLENFARQQRAILIKIDPDTDRSAVQDALLERGWQYSDEQIQFRNTALLDLTRSEEELLQAMKSKTRYNIRLAERKEVTVRIGSIQDIPLFYAMYAETGQRDGFLIRPLAYYHDAWQTFLEAGMGQMFLAEAQGETIGGVILFRFGQTAWYMYGASTERQRERMPNYALQWQAIRWAKSAGCTTYDLWGAPTVLDESDPLWGVWRFKEGLGAVWTPHIGAYDYATSPGLYRLLTVLLPRYRRLLRQFIGGRPAQKP